MTPEQARSLRYGLVIAAAYLRDDTAEVERLLTPFVQGDDLSAAADAFVYVSLVAIDTAVQSRHLPFQQVLDDIKALDGVTLLAGLPVGQWSEAVRLVSAAKQGTADREEVSLDVPGAVNVTFRLAVSALTELTKLPMFSTMTPAELADMFAQGIDAIYGGTEF
ncbi:MAG TPA: hypothetical protein VE465_09690 [Streptosporangiaceae bacterium]|jgi:hypothetical protein|nr:hypothetical protein [Streptosporangiaceae bacterium]